MHRPRGALLARWLLPKLAGLALLLLVLRLVGWEDRVEAKDGDVFTGRVERVTESIAVLDGRPIPIDGPHAVDRGLEGAFADLARAPGPTALGVLLLLANALGLVWRWGVLVRGAGLTTPPREILRLGWLGMFFNHVLPAGQVGGDVVKGVALARAHPRRRGLAVATVLADRGLGWLVHARVAAAGAAAAPAGSRVALAGAGGGRRTQPLYLNQSRKRFTNGGRIRAGSGGQERCGSRARWRW